VTNIINQISLPVIGVLNLLLGLFVLIRNPKKAVNKVFFLLAVCFSFWSFSLYFYSFTDILIGSLWIRLTYSMVILIVVLILYFSFIFPFESFRKARILAWLIGLFYLGVSFWLLFFTDLWVVEVVTNSANGIQTILGPGYLWWVIMGWVIWGWAIINFVIKLRSADPYSKSQINYFWVGFLFFSISSTILDVIIPLVFHDTSYFLHSVYGNLFFSGAIAYAIIKHRLMDVRLIVARSVAYVLLLVVLYAAYSLAIITSSRFFGVVLPIEHRVLIIMLGLIVVFSFNTIRKIIEKLTNKFFYKDQYDSEEVLDRLSNIMASTINLDNMTEGIINVLINSIHVSKAAFYILNENKKISRVYKDGGSDYQYLYENQMPLFRVEKGIFIFDEMGEGEQKDVMRQSNLSIVAPLTTKERDVGFLVLGGKGSGDIYFDKDIKLLEITIPQFAVAIQNAQNYLEIQLFSKTLKTKIEERTHELKLAQERELELKNQFVFIATHDLRTPVVAIDGYVKLINQGTDKFSDETQENFSAILESSKRLNQLVEDLLQVARGESGTLEVETESVDIIPALKTSITRVGLMAKEKGIEIEFKPDRIHSKVFADEARLNEVFENLLSNAVKFNKDGGKIVVTSEVVGNSELQINISDTGYGIPHEKQKQIFSKFFKHRNDKTRGVGGTGLGLFVVKMLVNKMNGQMSFTSEKNKGSTFSFTLPLAQKHQLGVKS